jgi:hypothetical protein
MQQQMRSLAAWMSQEEATAALLGHIPGAAEDTSVQRLLWEAARNILQQREPYAQPTPALDAIPPAMEAQADAFRQRADVAALFQGWNWTVGMVDLDRVLSFQKVVAQERAIERANAVQGDDPRTLFSFCLPDSQNDVNVPGAVDPDKKGITFSSLNPNLAVGAHVVLDIDVSAGPGQPSRKQKFVGFTLHFGSQFVQVAEYNGRWFVRDGYHRCYGLLRRGVNHIPCVFLRAASFEQLVPAQHTFFGYETLFGERPPFLKDFLDDTVFAAGVQMVTRKAVRISANEFVVVVD